MSDCHTLYLNSQVEPPPPRGEAHPGPEAHPGHDAHTGSWQWKTKERDGPWRKQVRRCEENRRKEKRRKEQLMARATKLSEEDKLDR